MAGKLKIYKDINTGKYYIWNGSGYEEYRDNSKQQSGSQSSSQNSEGPQNDSEQQPDNNQSKSGDSESEEKSNEENASQPDSSKAGGESDKESDTSSDDTSGSGDGDGDNVEDSDEADASDGDSGRPLSSYGKDTKTINAKDITGDSPLADRVKAIQDIFNDNQSRSDVISATRKKIDQEKITKQEREMARYRQGPLIKFKDNLQNFIKKEVDTGRGKTWKKFNAKYYGTGIIKPGTSRLTPKSIPLINVYFDRSGSWDDAKTEVGMQAIGTLNRFVQQGLIKIDIYYFSRNVHRTKQAAEREGSTYGQPILDHIQATKPDNVIILTDSDISDCTTDVTVPGSVWLLFKGGQSENLIEHIHGKKQTKIYDLDA